MEKEILYKFRSWLDPIHKGWLINREIYFASPNQFNDPFDCAINYRYDLLTEEEKLNKYINMIKNDNPKLSEDEVKKKAKEWMEKGLLEKEAHLEFNKTTKQKLVDEQVGVLSLTKIKNPILLWSHYADNHHGFCIGYGKQILFDFFIKKYNTIEKVFYDIDVTYSEEYPIIIPKDDIDPKDYVTIPLSTKAKFWEYECEKRILLLGGARELITIAPEAICEVTMGCNMSEKNKIEIGEFVIKNLPDVVLYESIKHDESFELIFKRINY